MHIYQKKYERQVGVRSKLYMSSFCYPFKKNFFDGFKARLHHMVMPFLQYHF